MTLRRKTLAIISVVTVGLIAVLHVISQVIVTGSFIDLERQYARQNVERVASVLSNEVSALDTMVSDWAAWDDTYAFIEDANEDYIRSNLVDETFTGFRINLMLFIDSSGRVVFGKAFDLHEEEEVAVPPGLYEHLSEDSPLLRHPNTASSVTGFVLLPEGPLLVASRPILTSEEEGPIRGTLIMGRYLDDAEIDRLAETTRSSLAIYRFDDPSAPVDIQTARLSLGETLVFVQPLSGEIIAGYALLQDVYGQPGLIVKSEMDRELYRRGRTVQVYFNASLVAISIALGTAIMVLLDRAFLSRLSRLSAGVNDVAASGNPAARVSMLGKDELSRLADAVNEMLAALERSDSDLRESEQRFHDVARTTGDWIWEMDTEGRYTYSNPVVEQVLGYTPQEVVGKSIYDLARPSGRETLRALFEGVLRRRELFAQLTSASVHKDGHTVLLETTGLPLTDKKGKLVGYRGTHRDITGKRQSERSLAAVRALGRELVLSRDRRRIAETTTNAVRLLLMCRACGLWVTDEETRTLINETCIVEGRAQKAHNLPMDSEQGIIAAVVRGGEPAYLPDVTKDPRYIDSGLGTRSELCVPLKVGERTIGAINAESENLDAFDVGDRQLLSTLADQAALAIENARLYDTLTQQREQLRALTMRLVEVEEDERQRLARELHDQVGQNLTALSINLNILQMQIPEETLDQAHDRLRDSLALVEQTTERIRDVMADLRPPVLDDYGLTAALRWYAEQFASRTGIAATVHGKELVPRPSTSIENALFRISQEALTNVAKHAHATQVTVTVDVADATIHLIVADDGVGFDPSSAGSPGEQCGWGLLNMTERAEALGGHCRIESQLQQGTRVIVEVPR
jgi:PAS domain S-box-containing protein